MVLLVVLMRTCNVVLAKDTSSAFDVLVHYFDLLLSSECTPNFEVSFLSLFCYQNAEVGCGILLDVAKERPTMLFWVKKEASLQLLHLFLPPLLSSCT